MLFYSLLAKTVRKISKIAGKKGTDLPGKVIRKLDSNVLSKLSKNFDEIVFVTGTNGKTTTSNLIGHTLKKSGYPIVNNFEGANMLDGIISAFAIQGNKDTKIAVIEIDEGSISNVMKYITPTKFVFNNFFRDQIDRFGEIDTLIENIGKELENKQISLILNTDDPFVTRLAKYGQNNVFFGIDSSAYTFKDFSINESKYCPVCAKQLTYSHIHYNQLGIYQCDNCDFQRIRPDYLVTQVTVNPLIKLSINHNKAFNTLQLGDFNIYNILSAYATLKTLGLSEAHIIEGLSTYTAHNGRMQTIITPNGVNNLLNLAKNPAGMNVSIALAHSMDKSIKINYLFALNDNGADGFDISWIWDTDFELLKEQNIKHIICAGKRAKELALRFKYADICANVIVEEDIKKAVTILKTYKENYNIVIPNYTALEETKKSLEDR